MTRRLILIGDYTELQIKEKPQLCGSRGGEANCCGVVLLRDFTGLEATGANPEASRLAINLGMNGLQVDIETPVAEIVGLAYIVTRTGFLAAYFANLSHHFLQIRFAI